MLWFLLALGSAFTNSAYNGLSKYLVSLGRYSKFTIVFWAALIAAVFLFLIALAFGLPELGSGFWTAIAITVAINIVTGPLMLKAYQSGEFSSVYSMILLTPVFMLATSFIFLGEAPSLIGVGGVLLTVLGLWRIAASGSHLPEKISETAGNIQRGNLLAILVALLWSVSANFDKLAAVHSNAVFAPAVSFAGIAAAMGIYLLIKYRGFSGFPTTQRTAYFLGLLPIGLTLVASSIFFNAALLSGFASYTIAIKRLGVLFGIFWGKIFFKEINIRKKVIGAAIAIAGAITILFS